MSRKSQAIAEGVQKFSWKIERIEDGFKATCKNFPSISAEGHDEQTALRLAQVKIRDASEKAEI